LQTTLQQLHPDLLMFSVLYKLLDYLFEVQLHQAQLTLTNGAICKKCCKTAWNSMVAHEIKKTYEIIQMLLATFSSFYFS